jgi:hypothetical protein
MSDWVLPIRRLPPRIYAPSWAGRIRQKESGQASAIGVPRKTESALGVKQIGRFMNAPYVSAPSRPAR